MGHTMLETILSQIICEAILTHRLQSSLQQEHKTAARREERGGRGGGKGRRKEEMHTQEEDEETDPAEEARANPSLRRRWSCNYGRKRTASLAFLDSLSILSSVFALSLHILAVFFFFTFLNFALSISSCLLRDIHCS